MAKNTDFTFQLKDNECVIIYIEDSTTKYYKIQDLIEKRRDEYPSATKKLNGI